MAPNALEGKTLGKYRVLEPLGRGGMAQVYRAYHPQLERFVAIKVLRSDLVEEEEFLARFRREARSVATLRHPNIVQVYDFDTQDDLYYMVMELLEGDTLKAYLNSYRTRNLTIPVVEIARIMQDVLKGLSHAHSEGIIHRDIKPANILLTKKGEAVITDFGIAQIVGGTNYTVSGALMGTLHYMAPEQGMGQAVDHRSDLYSLGIVLYEMLAGRPPFDADTPLAILLKHLNDPLPLPHQPDREIPAPFERVVLKALEKKPENRYQTALEMARAVREAASACEEARDLPESADNDLTIPPGEMPGLAQVSDPAVEPAEDLAVLSGTARERIADLKFADDDTDLNLSQSLNAAPVERAAPQPEKASVFRLEMEEPPAVNPPAGALPAMEVHEGGEAFSKAFTMFTSALGGVVSTALTAAAAGIEEGAPALKPVVEKFSITAEESDLGDPGPPISSGRAVAIGVGALVGVNLLAVYVGGATGWWGSFAYGWPAELLLVALLLSLLMATSGSIMMFVPIGILLGLGYLFGFYTITGAWWLWSVCWPAAPLIVAASIWLPIRWSKNGARATYLARRLGMLCAAAAGVGVFTAGWGSLLASAFRSLFG